MGKKWLHVCTVRANSGQNIEKTRKTQAAIFEEPGASKGSGAKAGYCLDPTQTPAKGDNHLSPLST